MLIVIVAGIMYTRRRDVSVGLGEEIRALLSEMREEFRQELEKATNKVRDERKDLNKALRRFMDHMDKNMSEISDKLGIMMRSSVWLPKPPSDAMHPTHSGRYSKAVIRVIQVGQNERPIGGASVKIDGVSVGETDENGELNVRLEHGRRILEVRKDGYMPVRLAIDYSGQRIKTIQLYEDMASKYGIKIDIEFVRCSFEAAIRAYILGLYNKCIEEVDDIIQHIIIELERKYAPEFLEIEMKLYDILDILRERGVHIPKLDTVEGLRRMRNASHHRGVKLTKRDADKGINIVLNFLRYWLPSDEISSLEKTYNISKIL